MSLAGAGNTKPIAHMKHLNEAAPTSSEATGSAGFSPSFYSSLSSELSALPSSFMRLANSDLISLDIPTPLQVGTAFIHYCQTGEPLPASLTEYAASSGNINDHLAEMIGPLFLHLRN